MLDSETETTKFLVEDLKLKHACAEGQAARMWARFNYFLAINAGLFFVLFKGNDINQLLNIADLIGIIGIIISVLWYTMGAQDVYHMATLRSQRDQSYDCIREQLKITGDFCYPAQTENLSTREPKGLHQWRISPISLSKFPSIFPLTILITWVAVLIRLYSY